MQGLCQAHMSLSAQALAPHRGALAAAPLQSRVAPRQRINCPPAAASCHIAATVMPRRVATGSRGWASRGRCCGTAVARCRAEASAGAPGESHPHAVDADYDALADSIRVSHLDVRNIRP